MAVVTLLSLTADNWKDVADLVVAKGQEAYVVPNVRTIAETQWYPWVQRRVIMSGDTIVGFAAYGRPDVDEQFWLHRLMIGAEYQGEGYGTAAMVALIGEWQAIPELGTIKVSYDPSNFVAERLYQRFGFVPGAIAEWGERVALLTLSPIT